MTKEEQELEQIRQWLRDKGFNGHANHSLVPRWMQEYAKEYATQIVLDTLPKSRDKELRPLSHEIFPYPSPCSVGKAIAIDGYRIGAIEGLDRMRTIATKRLTTREEVEKPFRELLEEILKQSSVPLELYERTNELLKSPIGEK